MIDTEVIDIKEKSIAATGLDGSVAETYSVPTPYLQRYVSARVTIYYNTGVSDTGRVSYIDNHWIELVKDSGECLLAPITGLRIIKMLEVGKPSSDAAMLLRASQDIEKRLEAKKLEEKKDERRRIGRE